MLYSIYNITLRKLKASMLIDDVGPNDMKTHGLVLNKDFKLDSSTEPRAGLEKPEF